MMKAKAQGAADYLLLTALMVAVVLAVAVPALREAEMTMAMSSARAAALDVASSNSLELAHFSYSVSASTVNVTPSFYRDGSPAAMPAGAGGAIARSVAKVFLAVPSGQCAQGVSYRFCISG